jgi:hypothetical protein
MLRREGKDHGEAAAWCVVGQEGSVYGFGEPAGQGEAKADADVGCGVAWALGGLEDAVAESGRRGSILRASGGRFQGCLSGVTVA